MPPPCGHNPPDLPPAGQPYAPPRCRLCWLYHNDPSYRGLWDGEPQPGRPPVGATPPIASWPLTARIIARWRIPEDVGLGDTIARHLDRFGGGEAFKRLFLKIVGRQCGCDKRQAKLNQLFPYPREITAAGGPGTPSPAA